MPISKFELPALLKFDRPTKLSGPENTISRPLPTDWQPSLLPTSGHKITGHAGTGTNYN